MDLGSRALRQQTRGLTSTSGQKIKPSAPGGSERRLQCTTFFHRWAETSSAVSVRNGRILLTISHRQFEPLEARRAWGPKAGGGWRGVPRLCRIESDLLTPPPNAAIF